MKKVPTILFSVLLVSLVYFTSSKPNQHQQRKFNYFLYRLEKVLNSSGDGFLPFELPAGLIENLRCTSDEFRELCLGYDAEYKNEDGFFSPITALNKTINYVFYNYKKNAKAKENIEKLEEIERVDPIGLNVYLTKKNVKNSSPKLMSSVAKFKTAMNNRVALFKMKTDDAYFSIFDKNDYENLQRFPRSFRERIATEYVDIPGGSIDMFTDLVTVLTSKRMYRIATTNLNVYQEHNSSTTDDIQIIFGTEFYERLHAVCINYNASTRKVHVYDSMLDRQLDDRQKEIIGRLYPYNLGIIFERPTALQDSHPTCGIFAITYATLLLLDRDPAITKMRLNEVHGDVTLYMRMHILNMLATRKLSLFK